ncbi:MAG: PQQ-binding-like beta-propeller repeat protein, partial [Streptosporangiaceae bacterium]
AVATVLIALPDRKPAGPAAAGEQALGQPPPVIGQPSASPRLTTLLVAWLAAVVVTGVVAGGTLAAAHWYTTSHRIVATVTSAARPPDGPAPLRPGRAVWNVRLPSDTVSMQVVAGYTIIADDDDALSGFDDDRVQVVNSADGRRRWEYRRQDAAIVIAGVTATAPYALVVQITDLSGRVTLGGFDLASGRPLWSATLHGQVIASQQPLTIASPYAVSDVVLTVSTPPEGDNTGLDSLPGRLTVRDGRTGRILWSTYRRHPCGIAAALAAGSRLLLDTECASDQPPTLAAFSLTDGRALWQETLPTASTIGLPVSGLQPVADAQVVAVSMSPAKPETANADADSWRFYRLRDGRPLWQLDNAGRFAMMGGQALSTDYDGVLSSHDALTGRLLWRGSPSGDSLDGGGGVVSGAARVYATVDAPFSLGPGGHVLLFVFDEASGRLAGQADLTKVSGDPCSRPSAVAGGPPVQRLCADQSLVGVSGGVLVIAADNNSFTVVSGIADGPGFTPAADARRNGR